MSDICCFDTDVLSCFLVPKPGDADWEQKNKIATTLINNLCQPVENQKLRYRLTELEGEEKSGAGWKRFPFLIMGLVFIAFGGWLFGRTIELSNEQIVGLVSALYFICVGQIYLAEFQKRSDDK